jgi:PIN domain nuclease of toxin-antitoxin system
VGGDEEVILLDPRLLIWLANAPEKLLRAAKEAIRKMREETGIAISAIPFRELTWLATEGRVDISGRVEAFPETKSSSRAMQPLMVKVAVLAN